MKSTGQQIQALRKQKALTQRELARLTAIDPAQLCRIEQGKFIPIPSTLRRVGEALSLSTEEIEALITRSREERMFRGVMERVVSEKKSKDVSSQRTKEVLQRILEIQEAFLKIILVFSHTYRSYLPVNMADVFYDIEMILEELKEKKGGKHSP